MKKQAVDNPGPSGLLEEPMESQAAALQRETSVQPIIARATQVIGNKDDAYRWLGTPVRALGYATPMSLMASQKGLKEVEIVLSRLEHGVV